MVEGEGVKLGVGVTEGVPEGLDVTDGEGDTETDCVAEGALVID